MWIFLLLWLSSGYILWHVSYQLFLKVDGDRCQPITMGDLFLGLIMMWFGLLLLFPVFLLGAAVLAEKYYDPLSDFFGREIIKNPCDWFRKKEPEQESAAPDFENMLRGSWTQSTNIAESEQVLIKVPEKDE